MIMLSVIVLSAVGAMPVFAATNADMHEGKAVVTISDPETGREWEWEIPQSEVKIQKAFAMGGEDNTVCSAGVGSTLKPTQNSWDISVNSAAGGCNSSLRPYSLLDCEVHITGMMSYRNISVRFELDL